jgi:hypothetical protein
MRYPVPPKQKQFKDEWGTGVREGYEDRGSFRPPRTPKREPGSPVLKYLGAICIVGGMFWGAWLVTQGSEVGVVLQQNHGPVALVGLGLVCSLVGKFVRF